MLRSPFLTWAGPKPDLNITWAWPWPWPWPDLDVTLSWRIFWPGTWAWQLNCDFALLCFVVKIELCYRFTIFNQLSSFSTDAFSTHKIGATFITRSPWNMVGSIISQFCNWSWPKPLLIPLNAAWAWIIIPTTTYLRIVLRPEWVFLKEYSYIYLLTT